MAIKNAAVLLLIFVIGRALGTHDLSDRYPFRLSLHNDYTLYWTFDNDAQNISFAVRVRTTGWVGFGVSPNGQMPQSDVVIGWVDGSGNSHFDDRFADGRSRPPVDDHQDWFLLRAEEEGGYTTLEFTRNYTSCDTRDRNIRHETSYVVWSWNDQDPVNDLPLQHTSQGSTVVNLLAGLTNPPPNPPDAENFSIGVTNVEIPAVDTTYWCQGFLLSQEIRQQTRYVTRFDISISNGSADYVHHLLVHACDTLDGVDLSQGGPCPSVDRKISACRSSPLIGAWAVGGQGFIYPENVAFPVGGPGSSRYLVIEMHYNNPNMVSGVRDSSSMVFTYTSTRRQHDAGILTVGHFVSHGMVIPPGVNNYTVTGICSSSCTQQGFPAGGIRIFGDTLHTHIAGIGLELSLLRVNNQCRSQRLEEVTFVDRNLNYDFNFQQSVHLPREVVVLPGDTLLLKCFYRTIGKDNVVVGGLATTDEMCLAFPIYYPRVSISNCLTTPAFNRYSDFVNQHVPRELQNEFFAATQQLRDRDTFVDTFNKLSWTESQVNGLRETLYTNGQQNDICLNEAGSALTTPDTCVPEPCCTYQENNTCTATNRIACCDRSCPAMRTLPSCALTAGASSLISQMLVFTTLSLVALLLAIL